MRKIIYSKFSNDRNPDYKIRTDIYEENKTRMVLKKGVTDGGKKHIAGLSKIYEELKKQSEGTVFDINKSDFTQDGLKLEYLYGETLEKLLDNALQKKNTDRFKELVKKYVDNVRKMANEEFAAGDEYYKIFGKAADASPSMAMHTSNIDMIFANVIVDADKWTVIDYEWSFLISIPVEFVLFRTINYYATPDREQMLKDVDLYELMGVDISKKECYAAMERSFQDYIVKGNTPLWRLYDSMGEPFYNMPELAKKKKSEHPTVIKILKDESTVSEPVRLKSLDDGVLEAKFSVDENVKVIMFNPAYSSCVVKLMGFKAYGAEEYEPKSLKNGEILNDDIILFKDENPYIMTDDIREETKSFVITYKLMTAGEGMHDEAVELFELFDLIQKNDELNQKIETVKQEDYQVVMELQAKLEATEHTVNAMKNSTSWKVTKPLRKLKRNKKQEK